MNERIKELMRQSGALKEQPEQQPMVVKDSNGLTLKAGWNAANLNSELWNQAFGMGLAAGKEIKKEGS